MLTVHGETARTASEIEARAQLKGDTGVGERAKQLLDMRATRREELVRVPSPTVLGGVGEHAKQRVGFPEGFPVSGGVLERAQIWHAVDRIRLCAISPSAGWLGG